MCEREVKPNIDISWQTITYEVAVPAFVFDGDGGFAILLSHFERPMLHVTSNVLIIHFASNKTLGIEYGVFWVGVESILSAVTDTEKNMSIVADIGWVVSYSLSSSVKLTHEGVIR
jgi:hypothetical protein